ncbi:MAG: AraC-like DNA-binding protein [Flavobacteriales bacterium]|jgi:AraC-like DNA-binding protein
MTHIAMLHDFLLHLYIVGTASSVVVAFLLAILIWRCSKTDNSIRQSPSFIIALVLLALALSVISNSLINRYFADLGGLSEPFQLLIGPLLLSYLQVLNRQALNQHGISLRSIALQLLPFMVVSAQLIAVCYWHYSVTNSVNTDTNPYSTYRLRLATSFSAYLLLWLYFFLCRKQIARLRNRLKQSCSDIERQSESWLTLSLGALLVAYSALSVIYILQHAAIYLPINKLLSIINAALIIYLGYTCLGRPQMFMHEVFAKLAGNSTDTANAFNTNTTTDVTDDAVQNEPSSSTNVIKTRYQKSSLSTAEAVSQVAVLRDYMLESRPYLEPEITLDSLAKSVNMSKHHLSQIINSECEQNFYDFINSYRVAAVKHKFESKDANALSILDLALASGFNSKASFNRIFKHATGQTPSAYRKSQTRSMSPYK